MRRERSDQSQRLDRWSFQSLIFGLGEPSTWSVQRPFTLSSRELPTEMPAARPAVVQGTVLGLHPTARAPLGSVSLSVRLEGLDRLSRAVTTMSTGTVARP